MKKFALYLLIVIFILLNYHLFYVILFENIINFIWVLKMYNKGYKKFNFIYNYSYNNSIQKYFNIYEKNKLHKDLVSSYSKVFFI